MDISKVKPLDEISILILVRLLDKFGRKINEKEYEFDSTIEDVDNYFESHIELLMRLFRDSKLYQLKNRKNIIALTLKHIIKSLSEHVVLDKRMSLKRTLVNVVRIL